MPFGLPFRRMTVCAASQLELAGLDRPVPDCPTPCGRKDTLAEQLPCRGAGGLPALRIDSTGITVRGKGDWHARKHCGARRHVRRDVHRAIDEATMKVRAVVITGSGAADAPALPGLQSRIPADEPIAPMIAPGANGGHACRDAIASRGTETFHPAQVER